MLEKVIIENCATTLANLKTGEIINFRFEHRENVNREIETLREKLEQRGVNIEVLVEREKSMLLYVYRKSRLERDLKCPVAKGILKEQGYTSWRTEQVVGMLKWRINRSMQRNKFPHEIGLFLSNPPKDVKGFIENRGKNYIYAGYWKVYEEKDKADEVFAKFDKCRSIYKQLFSQGAGIRKLTVAC